MGKLVIGLVLLAVLLVVLVAASSASANMHDVYFGGAWDPYDPVVDVVEVTHWPPCNEYRVIRPGAVQNIRHPRPADGRVGVWLERGAWYGTTRWTPDGPNGPVSYGEFVRGGVSLHYKRVMGFGDWKVLRLRNTSPDRFVWMLPC